MGINIEGPPYELVITSMTSSLAVLSFRLLGASFRWATGRRLGRARMLARRESRGCRLGRAGLHSTGFSRHRPARMSANSSSYGEGVNCGEERGRGRGTGRSSTPSRSCSIKLAHRLHI